MNISLTDELVQFVKTKVDSGRYTSSSEVVREALRLLEKQDQREQEKRDALRQAYREGVESGPATALDMDALRAEAARRLGSA